MSSGLDRPGWELGESNFFETSQQRRVAVYHRESNTGFWVEGVTDAEVIDRAQYKIDEIYLLRRFQLQTQLDTDEAEADTVTLL